GMGGGEEEIAADLLPLQREELAEPAAGLERGDDEIAQDIGPPLDTRRQEPFLLAWLQPARTRFLARELHGRDRADLERCRCNEAAEDGPVERRAQQREIPIAS